VAGGSECCAWIFGFRAVVLANLEDWNWMIRARTAIFVAFCPTIGEGYTLPREKTGLHIGLVLLSAPDDKLPSESTTSFRHLA
jgi:hypothetical protein